ncbi:MAG: tetratricopeptide repeat protein, partial [Anaerolineales bacterium]|nr:tetratricopeptide repeat protein [Anaerolineales bacterium]
MKRLGTLGLLMMALLVLAGCGASPANQLAEGNEAYTAGDYDTAVQNYRAAQAIDPDAPEPIFNIANALYRQGLPSEAQKLLELAQDVLPAEAQALAQNIWFNLGNARYEAGQATAAVEAYKQALRLDPTDQDAKYN